MLFVIDDSLASNLTDETTIEALGVMATACREGKHALFAYNGYQNSDRKNEIFKILEVNIKV